ncbi:TonB-dependent receptor [Pontibacter actiniarum]|uniref:TonB-dependent siderophore receptor n=1 Tax=Pontibacter actiniarum TaxID=323450 RepID=A0A1X9YMF0_9BACT|nr:TonB-dependent receptor [Pontibacter actiniarum]ARS34037.1 TonB-dependent siderophore receptor [Pontibacter actiniarum]
MKRTSILAFRGALPLALSLLFVLVSSIAALAQSGTIKGHITTTDSQPAIGVSIGLEGTVIGTTTDAQGNYTINRVKPGNYTLRVQMLGLEPQEQYVQVDNGKTSTANFTLVESASKLQEVIITSQRDKYKASLPSESLRLQTPLLETPQNIQIITNDVLKDQQVFTLLEGVTRNVSGVTMQEHWGNYTRMNMRGARVAPFRNGMNVESNWGPLSEDMSFVERIEFVKGPAGFMLANGDPAGFYNIVTKKPTGTPKQEVSLSFGSYETFRAAADLDGKLTKDGKLLYRLNLMGQTNESWRDYESNDRYAVAPVLKYRFSDKTSLTAEYTYQFSRMSAIGSAYVFSANGFEDLPRSFTIADPNLEPSDMKDHNAYLIFEHKLNDNWKLTAQTAYFYYNQEGSSLWAAGVDASGNMKRTLSGWDAQNKSKFGQLFVNGEFETGTVSHKILGGLDLGDKEYLADWSQYFVLDPEAPFNVYNPVYGNIAIPTLDHSVALEDRPTVSTLGQKYGALYLQDELGFFDDKLRLTLAGRYTKAETNQYTTIIKNEKFTPRVGISGSISKSLSVYALFDQAFIPQTGLLASGDQVDPITGNNLEVGVKKDWFNGRWNSTLSVYQITKKNQLIGDPTDPTGTYSLQMGESQTKGAELDVRGEIVPGLNLTFNYAYTNSEATEESTEFKPGDKVPGFAEHITNAWLSYKLPVSPLKGLGVSLGYQWQVNRYPWFASGDGGSELPDYFRLDGGLSYQIKNVRLALNVNNLLDDYLYSGAPYDFNYDGTNDGYYWQTEAPRSYRVTIGYRF